MEETKEAKQTGEDSQQGQGRQRKTDQLAGSSRSLPPPPGRGSRFLPCDVFRQALGGLISGSRLPLALRPCKVLHEAPEKLSPLPHTPQPQKYCWFPAPAPLQYRQLGEGRHHFSPPAPHPGGPFAKDVPLGPLGFPIWEALEINQVTEYRARELLPALPLAG